MSAESDQPSPEKPKRTVEEHLLGFAGVLGVFETEKLVLIRKQITPEVKSKKLTRLITEYQDEVRKLIQEQFPNDQDKNDYITAQMGIGLLDAVLYFQMGDTEYGRETLDYMRMYSGEMSHADQENFEDILNEVASDSQDETLEDTLNDVVPETTK